MSRRFRQDAERGLGRLETSGPGVWRAEVLQHPCLLVSTVDLPVDEDSCPLHVLGVEPLEKQHEVGLFVAEDPNRFHAYGSVFSTLHPTIWEEVKTMARSKRPRVEFSILPSVEYIGLDKVIEQIGEKQIIEQIGKKQIIEQIGKKKVLEQIDVDDILANLTPAKRRELQRRLQAEQTSLP